MHVTIKYFDDLREMMGKESHIVSLPFTEISIETLWQDYLAEGPLPANTRISVNQETAKLEDIVKDGDEVVLSHQ